MVTTYLLHVGYGLICISVFLFAACSSTKEVVVLLPEVESKNGVVTVTGRDQTITLDAPLAAAKVNARGYITPEMVTDLEIRQRFGQALAAEPPEPIHFTLYFDANATEVQSSSQPVLEALLTEVARRAAVEVQVTGHTDRVGTVTDNDQLSIERAQVVRGILLKYGLRADFVRTVGRGEREPLVPTPDEQEEPRNRRVEVIVR
jgi:outer membrane protein OmpA-like peptidoglycan-associated protein